MKQPPTDCWIGWCKACGTLWGVEYTKTAARKFRCYCGTKLKPRPLHMKLIDDSLRKKQ